MLLSGFALENWHGTSAFHHGVKIRALPAAGGRGILNKKALKNRHAAFLRSQELTNCGTTADLLRSTTKGAAKRSGITTTSHGMYGSGKANSQPTRLFDSVIESFVSRSRRRAS